MKKEKLFEILKLVDGVISKRWDMVMNLVECFNSVNVKIIKAEWYDDYKQKNPQYYPLDLKNIKTWSTFDDTCIDIKFTNKDNKLHCIAKIYDGDSFGGYRKNLRFTVECILPDEFTDLIENNINWEFDDFLENAYEDHLEAQKKLWINNMKCEILNK